MTTDWTSIILSLGTVFASLLGVVLAHQAKQEAARAAQGSARTEEKQESIVKLVDGGMKAAQDEIKRLSGIVEQFSKSGKPITEQEAGLILNKVIEVANGKHPHDPPIPNPVLPPSKQ